jgi:hypothetical protein
VDSPPGGDASLRIDATMNYEFERTNSESSHTIIPPDESHTPSLTNKLDFRSETHLFRRFTNFVIACYIMNYDVVVSVAATFRERAWEVDSDIR